jgi:hypothetical protein
VTCEQYFCGSSPQDNIERDGEYDYATTLEELEEAGLIDSVLAGGVKTGYLFVMTTLTVKRGRPPEYRARRPGGNTPSLSIRTVGLSPATAETASSSPVSSANPEWKMAVVWARHVSPGLVSVRISQHAIYFERRLNSGLIPFLREEPCGK